MNDTDPHWRSLCCWRTKWQTIGQIQISRDSSAFETQTLTVIPDFVVVVVVVVGLGGVYKEVFTTICIIHQFYKLRIVHVVLFLIVTYNGLNREWNCSHTMLLQQHQQFLHGQLQAKTLRSRKWHCVHGHLAS